MSTTLAIALLLAGGSQAADLSYTQALEQALQIPVVSIVKLQDLIEMLEESGEYSEFLGPVVNYREQYGA